MNEGNVIQLSMPRTGSTLLFQVLSDTLSDKTISKAHEWIPAYKEKPVFGSYRDPRATAVSYWRTNRNLNNPKRKMSKAEIAKYTRMINNQCISFEPFIKNTINHPRMIFLKYELFFNDFDYLFSEIESFFDIKISESLRLKVKKERSLESNKQISSKFNAFRQFDKKTLIHGKHIYKDGSNKGWKDFINTGDLSFFENSLKPAMKILGYE